jgi:iron complex transport system substrate-binding protein
MLLRGYVFALWCLSGIAATSVHADSADASHGVTDATGHVVTIPATVTRVADAWHANNAMILMLGGANKIVATTAQAQRQPWLHRLFPQIDRVPAAFNAAGEVNMETLIGAHPDVILTAYNGAEPKWAGQARASGIPVVMMPNESLNALKETLRMTGAVLGPRESQAAAEFIRYFDGNIRRVSAITGGIPPADRPRVLHTASAGILTVDGHHSVIDDWISIAGGRNAADVEGLGRPVTMEQVVAWNPDVIIVGTAPNGQNRQAILDDPRWRQISAVKSGKVYVNPSGAYLWDRHSAEAALQILWAAKVLHPEQFIDIDIKKETVEFYARYFHYALSDAEFASILNATAP